MKSGQILTVLVAIISMAAARNAPGDEKTGPYDIVPKGYEDCGNENALFHYDFKNDEVRLTSIIVSGRMVAETSVTEQIKMKSAIQKFSKTRGWIENYMMFDFGEKGTCSVASTALPKEEIDAILSHLIDKNNNSLTQFCDNPPGEVTFSRLKLDWSNFKGFPQFEYGKYRGKQTFYKDGVEIGCHMVYVDIVPKRKNKTKP